MKIGFALNTTYIVPNYSSTDEILSVGTLGKRIVFKKETVYVDSESLSGLGIHRDVPISEKTAWEECGTNERCQAYIADLLQLGFQFSPEFARRPSPPAFNLVVPYLPPYFMNVPGTSYETVLRVSTEKENIVFAKWKQSVETQKGTQVVSREFIHISNEQAVTECEASKSCKLFVENLRQMGFKLRKSE